MRCTLHEGGLSQKRKASGPNSRRGAQSLAAVDSDADTVDFSSDEDDEGLESEDGFEETQTQRGKESQIDRFLREVDEDADRKIQVNGEGKNWVHLTEGAFQPGPGHPNEQGLVQRNVHLAWLSTF